MTIHGTLTHQGEAYQLKYHDSDSFDQLPPEKCRQVYGVCFYNGKLVIGYEPSKGGWGLIGGTIEPGETLLQALAREVEEESNMEVLKSEPIGYQEVTAPRGEKYLQLRYYCEVAPQGEFIEDPAGAVTEVMLINPLTYSKYISWGPIGDRIIRRAIEKNNRS